VGTVVVVIAGLLDLQLHVQSMSITTKRCEFESRLWRDVLDTILSHKVVSDLRHVGGFLPPIKLTAATI
jgi:hypothetical protein